MMENQNGPPVKSNNPAPTVEQINSDRITQVPTNIPEFIYYYLHNKNYTNIL